MKSNDSSNDGMMESRERERNNADDIFMAFHMSRALSDFLTTTISNGKHIKIKSKSLNENEIC